MAKNFAEITFATAVKEMQGKPGSWASYTRMEKSTFTNGLKKNQIDYIAFHRSIILVITNSKKIK